jgi:hypothetical protein
VRFLAALVFLLAFASCATVGDVSEVAESVDELATVQADRDEQVAEALVALAAVVSPEVAAPLSAVAARLHDTASMRAAGAHAVAAAQAAEDRSGSIWGKLLSPDGVVYGGLSLVSMIGLNLYRNRTRKKALRR